MNQIYNSFNFIVTFKKEKFQLVSFFTTYIIVFVSYLALKNDIFAKLWVPPLLIIVTKVKYNGTIT